MATLDAASPRSRFPLWVAVVAAAASQIVKIDDFDLFWHIRTGQLIWDQKRIPSTDAFSYTSHGPLKYTEALAQLYFYWLDRLGGPVAIGIAHLLLVALLASLMAIIATRGTKTAAAPALAVTVWAMASHFRLGAKSEFFSFLCFALSLLCVQRAEVRSSSRPLYLLPLVFLLWGYLHRGGTLGLVLVAAYAVGWLLERRYRHLVLPCLVVLGASAAALCLAPGGPGYLSAAFDLSSRASFKATLPEWEPIPLSFLVTPVGAPFLLMVLVWSAELGRRWQLDAETIAGLMVVALAFSAVRFVPFAAIVMTPGVSSAVDRVLAIRFRARSELSGLDWIGACSVVLATAIGYRTMLPRGYAGLGLLPGRYPVDAAQFLAESPPPGRMWNPFDFGGYLIYSEWPRLQVFIDGRNDTVYTNHFYLESFFAERSPGALAHVLDTYGITFAVVRTSYMRRWPQTAERWVRVHTDPVATVLVKETSQTCAYLGSHGHSCAAAAIGAARD